jgi:hypothetical protein
MRGTKPLRSIEQAVKREGVIRAGEHVLIACSGGSDSVALAATLRALSKTLRLQLTLAHVNHGVRPSAWQDEAVVMRVAAALGLPFKVAGLELARAGEAEMREARYEALERLARHRMRSGRNGTQRKRSNRNGAARPFSRDRRRRSGRHARPQAAGQGYRPRASAAALGT